LKLFSKTLARSNDGLRLPLSTGETPCESYRKQRGAEQHGGLVPPPTFAGFIGIAT